MEWKTDALCLRAADYGENDRMVTLLTAERGKIGAAMKGVKKANAKLNFASQPFCFAEYVFAERSGRNTVTQASMHAGFYALRTRLDRFYAAASVLEVCDALTFESMDCRELLVAAVTALEELVTEDQAPMSALVRFLLRAAAFAGYPVLAEDCPVCGKKLVGRRYFDMAGGAFNCCECAVGVPASETTYEAVRFALGKSSRPDPERERDGNLRALRLLKTYIAYQTECEFKSLAEFLELA